jgi:hypothetical protein
MPAIAADTPAAITASPEVTAATMAQSIVVADSMAVVAASADLTVAAVASTGVAVEVDSTAAVVVGPTAEVADMVVVDTAKSSRQNRQMGR